MTEAQFDSEAWIERLVQLLPALAQKQEPYLHEYQERHARVIKLRDGKSPPFPLDDLRLLYDEVRDSRPWNLEAHYAPLRAVLDPVRHALLAHPTLARVAVTGRLIGDNRFSMDILGSDGDIYAGTLISGLMARATELPDDGFRTALRELNAFLSPIGDGAETEALGSLDEACDMLLFHGLTLSERIEVEGGMVLLPYEEVLRFADEETVWDFAPSFAGFHGWRAVGAVARPFRWRPEFRQRSSLNGPVGPPPPPFFPDAAALLDLLAVSHATHVAPLAELRNRIDGSAGRLLGQETQSPGFYRSWSAQGVDGLAECPAMGQGALGEALEVFHNRTSARYERMAPIVTRLSEALARDGRFAVADRLLDVAMSLERMYVLDENKIGHKLRNRAARFLASDATSQQEIKDAVRELYDVRSDIVHNRLHKLTPERVHAAFCDGFDIARRSLFNMLGEGMPEDWNASGNVGEDGSEEEVRWRLTSHAPSST